MAWHRHREKIIMVARLPKTWMISSMKREPGGKPREKKRFLQPRWSSCSTDKHKEANVFDSFIPCENFRAVGVCLSTLQFLLSTRGWQTRNNILRVAMQRLDSDLTRLLSIPCLLRIRITHTHTFFKIAFLHNAVSHSSSHMEMTREPSEL